MPLFRRRPTLPADVRRRLDLGAGDRVVASAQLVDGWAVATVRGLSLALDGQDVRRRPWSDVDRATLDPATSTLSVMWVEGAPDLLRLTDDRPAAFPAALRERVQSSVVHSETVTTRDGQRIRVALRRDENGALLTQVLGDERVDLSDPAVAALVDAAEARVREAAGLPR
ncbi:hypothetical protein [Cellulomonas aerilata]|uniref:Uncharacterized protein n=1 Tax=Cellulomonas aerilata TaxID=515326 RepID=A0A512DBS2_9CELL|nr:hypothetical protein [Cellulomonas aerilata]GEO33857.1 hypothetical protein CAE01nite_15820 [Cellulomonas aerilata]